jgi:hypothetical protein
MKKIVKTIFVIIFIANQVVASDSIFLKKNNIGLRPLAANSQGVGMGITFERYLDSSQNFSLVIPFDYIFYTSLQRNNILSNNTFSHSGFTLMPSFRIYFKSPRTFNWFIGIGPYYSYTHFIEAYNTYESREYAVGSITNIGFKTTIKNKVSVSFDIGTGILFSDRIENIDYISNISYQSNSVQGLLALGLNVGYIF